MNSSIFNCILALVIEVMYVIGCFLKGYFANRMKTV